jgi:hypothetical protein
MTHNVYALVIGRAFNEFSARNCSPIANKKLMKCTSRPAIANATVQATPAVGFSAKKSSLHHKASHLLFIKNKQK